MVIWQYIVQADDIIKADAKPSILCPPKLVQEQTAIFQILITLFDYIYSLLCTTVALNSHNNNTIKDLINEEIHSKSHP